MYIRKNIKLIILINIFFCSCLSNAEEMINTSNNNVRFLDLSRSSDNELTKKTSETFFGRSFFNTNDYSIENSKNYSSNSIENFEKLLSNEIAHVVNTISKPNFKTPQEISPEIDNLKESKSLTTNIRKQEIDNIVLYDSNKNIDNLEDLKNSNGFIKEPITPITENERKLFFHPQYYNTNIQIKRIDKTEEPVNDKINFYDKIKIIEKQKERGISKVVNLDLLKSNKINLIEQKIEDKSSIQSFISQIEIIDRKVKIEDLDFNRNEEIEKIKTENEEEIPITYNNIDSKNEFKLKDISGNENIISPSQTKKSADEIVYYNNENVRSSNINNDDFVPADEFLSYIKNTTQADLILLDNYFVFDKSQAPYYSNVNKRVKDEINFKKIYVSGREILGIVYGLVNNTGMDFSYEFQKGIVIANDSKILINNKEFSPYEEYVLLITNNIFNNDKYSFLLEQKDIFEEKINYKELKKNI